MMSSGCLDMLWDFGLYLETGYGARNRFHHGMALYAKVVSVSRVTMLANFLATEPWT